MAQEPKIQQIPGTSLNRRGMDHRQVRHRSPKSIPILDPEDVETAYGYSASCYHCIQSNVRSYGWLHAILGKEVDPMEGRVILCHEVCATEAVHIVFCSNSND